MDQLHSSATGPATPNAPTLDVEDIIQDYLGEGLSAKENANMSHLSPAGLLLVLGEAGLKRDYLYKLRLAGHTALADWHELGMVHIHDLGLGVKTPYCSGHSLENLLHEGISAGNIISGPAKRLRSAVNHIINHIGACSNEFAGAQAFNDIDLFLGPYALDFFISRVRTFNMDAEMAIKMTMEEVDQSMQELIFHLNYNTRYGGQCVTPDTECLTPSGWKTYEELNVGDPIYVVDTETGELRTDNTTHVNVYDFSGDLLRFKGRCADILVTPNHRMVYRKSNVGGKLGVLDAQKLAKRTVINIPNSARLDRPDNVAWTDDRVRMLAWVLSDAHMETGRCSRIRIYQTEKKFAEEIRELLHRLQIPYTEGEDVGEWGSVVVMFGIHGDVAREWISIAGGERNRIPAEALNTFSARQARLFITEYVKADGHIEPNGRTRIGKKYETMVDDLQHMMVLAGIGSTLMRRKPGEKCVTHALSVLKSDVVSVSEVENFAYTGKVWCPTTNTGTFIARRNNKVFVTGNSPFSNVTLSLTIPDDMRDRRPLVGGQTLEDRWGADTFAASCAGDHVTYGDLAMWQNIVGEAILNNFMRGDSKGTGFTFPVLTISVTDEFFQHPLKKKVFELSAKFGNPYFQNYINGYSGGEKLNPSDVRSMCPLAGDTLLPLRAGRGVFIQKIAVAYDAQERAGASYEALHNGAWEKARVIRVDDCAATVTIKLANGIQVVMDDRHEQPARVSKNSSTEVFKGGELNEGMYLPVAATGIADEYDNYIAGYVAGAYVGDGSIIKGGVDECCKSLIFSLSTSGKKVHARSVIENFFAAQGYKVSITEKEDVALVSLRIGCAGDAAERWVRQFVEGDTAQEKKLTQRVFQLGGAFLRGLLDGWMATDGGNRGRIYTASETLAEQFCHVCGMLGVHYNMRIDKPDTRDGRLGTNPVYTCKVHTRDCYGNVFFFADGYYWFPIESISVKREDGLKTMYCLAVDSDEHLFQLANGLVTHNCRLSINEKEIRKHVGGLFGNADQTGSLQVVTLNLPMLAMTARQISGDDVAARYSNFVNIIDAVMEKVKAEQLWKREIVERSFDEGFFSMAKANFKRGFKTFFTTVGFVGLWEAIEAITGDEDSFLKEENLQMAVDVLNHMRGVTDRWTEETGKLFNLEATPAESAAHKLAIKMLKTFPDAPHRGTAEAPYLTNSCHIPVELQNRVDLLMQTQSRLQPLLSGGTVLHLHVGEELDSDGVEAMVRAMCGSPIPYFSVSPVYTKCDCCGRIIPGTHEYCPHEHTDEQVEALRRRRPDLIEE